jgi:hypothetical protein
LGQAFGTGKWQELERGNCANPSVGEGANEKVLPPEFVGRVETPYGVQYINRREASDHASMCSVQLTALLMMKDEGAERFRILSPGHQESLIWMITELSSEIEAMFDIMAADVLRSAQ